MSNGLTSNVINRITEMHKCHGYSLFRQFIITCAILLETIIIEIHQDNNSDIIDKFEKEKGRPPTLGQILYYNETKKLLTTELNELCKKFLGLRYLGSLFFIER